MPEKSRLGVALPPSPGLPLGEVPRAQSSPTRASWLPLAFDLSGECLHEHTSFSKV
jgi:hypothetical protein